MEQHYVKSFDLNGSVIKTTVSDMYNVVDDHISLFERQVNDYSSSTKFFGFDTDWSIDSDYKCVISICDGHSCLVFPLRGSARVFQSLVNFLAHPNYIFVGVGIKDNVNKLNKAFGIGCRNAVELAPWAATDLRKSRLNYCGVDELAYAVCALDLRMHRPLCPDFHSWGRCKLSRKLVKHATINVFSYQKIGITLFGRDH